MAVLTYMTLQITDPAIARIVVFCAGLAMAPVFPTTLGIVGDAFPKANRHGHGDRDHVRLDRPGGERSGNRRDRRERSHAFEVRAAAVPGVFDIDGSGEFGPARILETQSRV